MKRRWSMRHERLALRTLTCFAVIFWAAGCGDDGGPSANTSTVTTAANTSTTVASTTAPTTTAAPTTTVAATTTTRAVVATAAMLAPMGLAKERLASFFQSTPTNQTRIDATDVALAFSSSPDLINFLKSQNATMNYNAWQATAACVVCAVQVPVMVFASPAGAATAYAKIKEINEAIFKNVKPQAGFGAYWDASFCQTGDFTTSAGQTTQWFFCAFSKGNAVVTTAIGGINFNTTTVADALKSYANGVETYLKSQFP